MNTKIINETTKTAEEQTMYESNLFALASALYATRQNKGYVSIAEVADILLTEWQREEILALCRIMENKIKEKDDN